MLQNLLNSNRYKKEIKRFERDINQISNVVAREHGFKLLEKLKFQTNIINLAHSPFSAPDLNNEKIRENAQIVMDIRNQIFKLIKDSKT